MAKKSVQTQQEGLDPRVMIWVGIAAAVILFSILGVVIWQATASPFSIADGPKSLTVLLRNTHDGTYRLEYNGDEPATINRLLPMIEGQEFHMDVEGVVLVHDGREIALDTSGYPVDSPTLVLQNGDTFDVRITYLGQTLGGNYLYGFRLGYEVEGSAQELDLLTDREYTIFVE